MPKLQVDGGYLRLKKYDGPEIPREEYENLTYTTYSTDDQATFAPITSATAALELKGFDSYGKPDLDGVRTEMPRSARRTSATWSRSAPASAASSC